ncbi:polysaccharide pyruvyl transferase family protein [Sphingobacterium chungjuense]|uniref:polysaccharide pyruvyl transferase family protein n=1 Tax=Sphingobacterium chungjuense TaxID=2675553 RepID=UPI00140E448F|nr:polysaccharide pyruvyl transferase family protein [Sphingobacterium chungjuense]
MKIGILTLPLHTNYGGNLQAYALMSILKELGHEVYLIDRKKDRIAIKDFPITVIKRFVGKYILRRPGIELFKEYAEEQQLKILGKRTKFFLDKYVQPKTKAFYSSLMLHRNIENYQFDAIIVGSDQVWRPRYTPNIFDYFLGFLSRESSTRRIAYAASFGTDEWTFSNQETIGCAGLLQKFNYVGVREDSGVILCQDKFSTPATHVLDPTMLIEESYYTKLFTPSDTDKLGKKLLVYVLDENADKTRVINHIAERYNLEVSRVNSEIENKSIPLKNRVAPHTEEWVKGFYEASFVVADSFHACAFAIIFNKPFVIYGNPKRGLTRFTSLLKMFELEDRLIIDSSMLNDKLMNTPINWERVNYLLNEYRINSKSFLENALN